MMVFNWLVERLAISSSWLFFFTFCFAFSFLVPSSPPPPPPSIEIQTFCVVVTTAAAAAAAAAAASKKRKRHKGGRKLNLILIRPMIIWFLLSVLLGCAMAAGEKRPASFSYDWFKLPPVENSMLSDFDIFAQGRSIYGLLYDVGYLTDPDVKTQLSKALKYELLSNRDYIPRNH